MVYCWIDVLFHFVVLLFCCFFSIEIINTRSNLNSILCFEVWQFFCFFSLNCRRNSRDWERSANGSIVSLSLIRKYLKVGLEILQMDMLSFCHLNFCRLWLYPIDTSVCLAVYKELLLKCFNYLRVIHDICDIILCRICLCPHNIAPCFHPFWHTLSPSLQMLSYLPELICMVFGHSCLVIFWRKCSITF